MERVAKLWEALGQRSFKQILNILEGNLKKGRGLIKRAKKG